MNSGTEDTGRGAAHEGERVPQGPLFPREKLRINVARAPGRLGGPLLH